MRKTDSLADSITTAALRPIAEKIEANIPVDESDARIMLKADAILDLGFLARRMKQRIHQDTVYYSVNMNLNYTNICELRCPLCAFSCDSSAPEGYVLSLDEIEKRLQRGMAVGIDEVHIVGGLNPDLTLDYMETMVRRIKEIKPDIFVVAFTAAEYDYFAEKSGLPLETVVARLIDAGVNALPGGGAEIFSSRVREIIAPKKISGDRWLEVMRTAHRMGLKTNATMLYNHLEETDDIIDHLFRLRSLQDETGGFKAFVPLSFHEAHTSIKARRREPTGLDEIRIYAASRIILHNIPHLKALWMYLGEKMAQTLLHFGVDEMGGTYNDEKVVHAAGAKTPDLGSEAFLRRMIVDAGMIPERTTAGYSRRYEARP